MAEEKTNKKYRTRKILKEVIQNELENPLESLYER